MNRRDFIKTCLAFGATLSLPKEVIAEIESDTLPGIPDAIHRSAYRPNSVYRIEVISADPMKVARLTLWRGTTCILIVGAGGSGVYWRAGPNDEIVDVGFDGSILRVEADEHTVGSVFFTDGRIWMVSKGHSIEARWRV